MAEPTPPASTAALDPGAPIARDQIDPDLVKLSRRQAQVGVITALGLMILCSVLIARLSPDRRFAGSGAPTRATVADIAAGRVEPEQRVEVEAEPLIASAIRATKSKGSFGHRLAPVRGSHEAVWLVISGDGDAPPAGRSHVGRLRKLDDLALAGAARAYAASHPRPVFATAAEVRRGLASGAVATVTGDTVQLADADGVELDLVEPAISTLVASFNDALPDIATWQARLGKAGVPIAATGAPDAALGLVRFTIAAPVPVTISKLEAEKLFDARVEPVTRHIRTTWGALRGSPADALAVGPTAVPDAQIDLLGLHVHRPIPGDAYAIVAGEDPADYWYVLPITVALAVIALVFAWALIRAVRRDLVPARAA